MTTGRINQVTGLGLDHDSTRPCGMRVPGLPRSCKKQLSSITKKGRSRRMPSHTSNANPGKLKPEVATHREAHQRLHTQHRGTCEPFQYGTDTTPKRDRDADHAERNRLEQFEAHTKASTRSNPESVFSTAARNVGSLTRRHRNTHTKPWIRSADFTSALPTRIQLPFSRLRTVPAPSNFL